MTADEFDMLEYVDGGRANGYAGMFTGRRYPKRVAEALAERGLLERLDLQPADGDGHCQWHRARRQGYALTPAGKAAFDHEQSARSRGAAPPKAGEL